MTDTERRCPLCNQPLNEDIGFYYDRRTSIAIFGKRALRFGIVEAAMFARLLDNFGEVVPMEDLIFAAYGNALNADRPESPEQVIRVAAHRLRQKLAGAKFPVQIGTVKGFGYVMAKQ